MTLTLDDWKREAAVVYALWPANPWPAQTVAAAFDVLRRLDAQDIRQGIRDLAAEPRQFPPSAGEIRAAAVSARQRRHESERGHLRALPAPKEDTSEIAVQASDLLKRLRLRPVDPPAPEPDERPMRPPLRGSGLVGDPDAILETLRPSAFRPRWRWYDDRLGGRIHARWHRDPYKRDGVDPTPCGAETRACLTDREAQDALPWRCPECAEAVVESRDREEVSA